MPEGKNNVLTANAIADLRALKSSVNGLASSRPPVRAASPIILPKQVILINTDSSDCPSGGCLAVTDTIETNDAIILKCTQPGTDFFREHVAAPYGGVDGHNGTAVLDPCARQLLLCGDATQPVNGECVGPKPSDWKWWKGYPEAATVCGKYDTDKKICVATVKLITELLVTTNSSIAKGGTGDCDVLKVNSDMTTDSIGMTLESVASPFVDVDSGKLCMVQWINGYPALTAKECP